MNIQAICDGDGSSASSWMRGVSKHSKHNVRVCQWWPNDSDADLIYFHYGSLANNNVKFIEDHPDIPFGIGVLGMHDFACIVGWGKTPNHILNMRGAIVLGTQYHKMFTDRIKNYPAYICDVGVDTMFFARAPPTKHFVIGYAENNNYPFTDDTLKRFLKYGFPVITAGSGKGTARAFSDMPKFYGMVSVFIDNILDPRPGGLMYLEAGSVGRPVINMRSGTMADWFPREFLAEDDADVVKKLTRLKDDPEYYQYASDLWRKVAESRDYSIIYQEYDRAWEAMAGEG